MGMWAMLLTFQKYTFRTEVCKSGEFLCMYRFMFRKYHGGRASEVLAKLPMCSWSKHQSWINIKNMYIQEVFVYAVPSSDKLTLLVWFICSPDDNRVFMSVYRGCLQKVLEYLGDHIQVRCVLIIIFLTKQLFDYYQSRIQGFVCWKLKW